MQPDRWLVNLAAAGLRPHCSAAGTSELWLPTTRPTTPPIDKRQSNSADTAPSSLNAAQQPTPETNAGTSGEATTTPADRKHNEQRDPRAADRKQARKKASRPVRFKQECGLRECIPRPHSASVLLLLLAARLVHRLARRMTLRPRVVRAL
jgi:hypothetical protein